MTAIQKDKKKLLTTFNDIKMAKPKGGSHQDKGQVYFQTSLSPEQDIMARVARTKALEEDMVNVQASMEEKFNSSKQYNDNIAKHLPMYPSMKPTNNILVRLFLREPKKTESGLFIPETNASDLIEVKRRAASGDRYTQKLDESPWKWSTKAIVVALPKFVTDYTVGQLVQVPFFPTGATKKEDESLEMTFMYAFIHCESGTTEIPKDCLDPHFGYALIPTHEIKCIL